MPAVNTLAIDIGGSGLKAAVLDASGKMLGERVRIDTPVGAPPEMIVALLAGLVRELPAYQRVAVGFPGMVRNGFVLTAPNLGHAGWHGFDLAGALQNELHHPVRVANDADVQGLAVIAGRGLEMVITLGTGFGTGLYQDGRLCPHLEISHQPFRKGETYDQQLGNAARKRIGNAKWEKRVWKAIANLRTLTHFDRLYLGGGNARRITRELPPEISIVDNLAGLSGGARLWQGGATDNGCMPGTPAATGPA
ncbi:MAG: ROK family protein [Planctomycetes bacterium]|nr:ROK family protein [Planctomycetota bacterium]